MAVCVSQPESVLVAGAINTDLVATIDRAPAAGETLNGTSFAIHGGGKAANQAVAAARSGATVALIGAVGKDDFGRARLDDLGRDGVDTRWVRVDDSVSSGVALIWVEGSGENRIVCVPGATDTVAVDHALAAFAAVSPSWLLATNELSADVLDGLFRAARARDTRIVFNAAPEPARRAGFLDPVDILIANQVEAAALLGQPEFPDPGVAARELHAHGVSTVVLTLGAAGVIVSDENGVERVPPPTVTVVDTTGAGDTFAGTLVAELSVGASMHEAVRYAVHASALSVTRQGAQSAIPTRSDVLAEWPQFAGPT